MKQKFGLYLILTDPVAGYEACAQAVVDCGLRYLQLRMKNTPRSEIIATAIALREITRGSETHFIVNDDLSVAIESDADGIHLGQDDLSVEEAREQWNTPGKIFGLSTHCMEQAARAENANPNYIGIGPVFPTQTKANAAPSLGAAEVGRIAQATPLPSVAIGGINTENLPGLLQAGSDNFCVVGAVNQSPDPVAAIQQMQEIWKSIVF